ncbi:MAG: hypothetical protein JO179_21560 [Solirubrobacterales bacterium]|nr:hypothetical protein [Solirubrobacterales bacterium]
MRHLRTLTAFAATASLALAAAPSAFASTSGVGNSNGTPTMNVCVAMQNCTYINFHKGQPSDVVKHTGKLVDWSVNAGSTGGQVRLRILRPVNGGKFKAIRSSSLRTITNIGLNKFSASIPVKKGDVLALTNDTSGIYMAPAPLGNGIHYFSSTLNNGATGTPDRHASQLHVLLSAHVKF